MTTFRASSKDGKFAMESPQEAERFKMFLFKNPDIRLEIRPYLPESRKQRNYLHGGVYALWAYLDGKDHRDSEIIDHMHNISKREFNPEIFMLNGKKHTVGGSTKGKLNDGYVDRVIDYLEESYGIDRTKVLDPELFKKFKNEIYMHGKYDDFIQYLIDLKLLKPR